MKVAIFLIVVAAIVYGILMFDESFMADDTTHVMKVVVPKAK